MADEAHKIEIKVEGGRARDIIIDGEPFCEKSRANGLMVTGCDLHVAAADLPRLTIHCISKASIHTMAKVVTEVGNKDNRDTAGVSSEAVGVPN